MKILSKAFLISLFLFFFFLLTTNNSTADTNPVMIKDIKTVGSAFYSSLVKAGDLIFFTATNNDGYDLLWRTDGTTEGTFVPKDILPGGDSYPDYLAKVNEEIFFNAYTDEYGFELWKSDGTEEGTYMVKDIYLGGDSYPGDMIEFKGEAFFGADDGVYGYELWKSDGTPEGTVLVKDINTESGEGSSAYLFTVVEEKLFFIADDGIHDFEIWVSDGTEEGTYLVKDIYPTHTIVMTLSNLTAVGDLLYFRTSDAVHGYEIWRSDGTEDGTYMVKDINPGSASSDAAGYFMFKDYVFFSANDGVNGVELWTTDGTEGNAELFLDINEGNNSSSPSGFFQFNDSVLFKANDGVNGTELWITDGTPEGTHILKDINPGSGSTLLGFFVEAAGEVYFKADLGDGYKLWKTDGTSEGTVAVFDSGPDLIIYNFSELLLLNNELIFLADDGIHYYELWKYTLPDNIAPTGSVSINMGALQSPSTTVSLTLSATDNASVVSEMIICNNSSFIGCNWEEFKLSKSWVLGGTGTQVVYAKYKDLVGNQSVVYSDSIFILSNTVQENNVVKIPDKTSLSYYFPTISLEEEPVIKIIEEEGKEFKKSLRILDQDGNPLKGALVKILGNEYYTNSEGIVFISGLNEDTRYSISITVLNQQYEKEILGIEEEDIVLVIQEGLEEPERNILPLWIALSLIIFVLIVITGRKLLKKRAY